MNELQQAVKEYQEMGLDPIPLRPLSKSPLRKNWPLIEPNLQWNNAPKESNLGLRCGGAEAFCVLDSDDKNQPTWPHLVIFLWGLGFEPNSYPVIVTPHRGRHAYFAMEGTMPGNIRLFRPDFGSGEFRFGNGAFVAAPPSFLVDGDYKLESGNLAYRPRLRAADLLPILGESLEKPIEQNFSRRNISRDMIGLLKGKHIDRYKSRSEAEQAILTNLVSCGYPFDEVLSLFLKYPAAGKFKEMWKDDPRKAEKWLETSFQKALGYISTHQSQVLKQLLNQLAWVKNQAWPGRTGSSDRAVYLAHLNISLNTYKFTYSASSRELAEKSGVTRPTVEKANHRLIQQGLIELTQKWAELQSAEYQLILHPLSTLSQGIDRVDKGCNITAHDAFRYKGLGKSAGEIYAALLEKPMTKKELALQTGRNYITVHRALLRMTMLEDPFTREAYPMVSRQGTHWHALNVDLDRVAQMVRTSGSLARQKKQHRREREIHRRTMMLTSKLENGTNGAEL